MIDSTDIKIRKEELRKKLDVTSQQIANDWNGIVGTKEKNASNKGDSLANIINKAILTYDIVMLFFKLRKILKRKR